MVAMGATRLNKNGVIPPTKEVHRRFNCNADSVRNVTRALPSRGVTQLCNIPIISYSDFPVGCVEITVRRSGFIELLTFSNSIRPTRCRTGISDFEHSVLCFSEKATISDVKRAILAPKNHAANPDIGSCWVIYSIGSPPLTWLGLSVRRPSPYIAVIVMYQKSTGTFSQSEKCCFLNCFPLDDLEKCRYNGVRRG